MLRELPYAQFLEWQEYDRIEPIGGLRGDWQIASVCSLIANLATARSGSDVKFKASDFLLEWKSAEEIKAAAEVTEVKKVEAPAPAWQQMKFYAQMYAAQANADVKKKQQKRKR